MYCYLLKGKFQTKKCTMKVTTPPIKTKVRNSRGQLFSNYFPRFLILRNTITREKAKYWMVNFVCKLKPIIIKSYTESNELLKITRLHNPIVCSGLLLKQAQAYIYIRLIASGIDKIDNCPKCLKGKHFQKFCSPPNLHQMVQSPIGIKSRC